MAEIREKRIGPFVRSLILLRMKNDPDSAVLTPVAAARRRLPRHWRRRGGAVKKTENNYVAKVAGPIWGNRKGAGARPANDNAAQAPAEFRRFLARCRALCSSARKLLSTRRRQGRAP
jgi:hypothetical protein